MSDPEIYRRLAALERWRDDMYSVELPRVIAVRYQSNAGQSIPDNTTTIVNFEDQTFDPLGLVTTGAGWAFTAPVAGYYRITAALLFDSTATWADGESMALQAFRNGSAVDVLYRRDNNASAANTFAWAGGSDVVELATGDTLDIRVTQESGGSLSLNTNALFTYVAIEKIN